MGEKPSLAIIASDNDDLPSPVLLPTPRPAHPSRRPAHALSTTVMSEIRRKLVIVGDGACGKVLLLPSVISYHPRLTSHAPAHRPVC